MRARCYSCFLLLHLLLPFLYRSVLAELQSFRTEPTIRVPFLNITTFNDTSRLYDGYIFFGPFVKYKIDHHGPLIYDKSGDLIWSGFEHTGIKQRVDNFTPCDYLGSSGDHLCWVGSPVFEDGQARGGQTVFDNTYKEVCNINEAMGDMDIANPHEFNVLKGGRSLLQVVYQKTKVDMTPYMGPKDGLIYEACFQEIDIEKRASVFDWCFLDHLPVWDTEAFPNVTDAVNHTLPEFGNGKKKTPWDPHHINSADKNTDGDYIISLRHLYQVLKIAGNNNLNGHEPGTILWRLGGKSGNVEINSTDIPFSTQHMARFVSSNSTGDVVSLMNNAWQLQADHPDDYVSSGQVWFVNNSTMSAELLHEYPAPHGEAAEATGSMVVLPNGNALVGWGLNPQITEYAEDGTVLLDLSWYDAGGRDKDVNYRAYSATWKGYPQQPPKVIAYKKTCDSSPLVLHVSWNGATEVDAWRVSTKAFEKQPWVRVGTFKKQGFETMIDLSDGNGLAHVIHQAIGFVAYVSVQALDVDGRVLNGVETRTFVPTEETIEEMNCDDLGCDDPFDYISSLSIADSCTRRAAAPIAALIATLGVVVAAVYCLKRAIEFGVRSRRSRAQYALVQNEEYSDGPIALEDVVEAKTVT